MRIDKYLSSMLPSFEKSRVKEDIGLLREELKDSVLPTYASAAEAMKKRRWANRDVKDFDKKFDKEVDLRRVRGNFIVVTDAVMNRVYENLDTVESLVERYYTNDIFRDAMTYLKINLLQYIEAISFASRYARRILLWTYSLEMAEEDKQGEVGEMTKGEKEWLQQNQTTFFRCLNLLWVEKKELTDKFDEIPDVVATEENNEFMPKTVGQQRMDPFHFNLIPVVLNPIYHIRMAVAEWQVSRHQAAREEKRMLEFRLLQLKQAEEGKQDAKLEQQIEYTQGRIERLNYKIQKMEDEYAR